MVSRARHSSGNSESGKPTMTTSASASRASEPMAPRCSRRPTTSMSSSSDTTLLMMSHSIRGISTRRTRVCRTVWLPFSDSLNDYGCCGGADMDEAIQIRARNGTRPSQPSLKTRSRHSLDLRGRQQRKEIVDRGADLTVVCAHPPQCRAHRPRIRNRLREMHQQEIADLGGAEDRERRLEMSCSPQPRRL